MTGTPIELRTERLILRRWREEDREPFARMNCDPMVMEHFPALLSREDSNAMVDRAEAHLRENCRGFWLSPVGTVEFSPGRQSWVSVERTNSSVRDG